MKPQIEAERKSIKKWCTCGLRHHLEHHHPKQGHLLLSYTHAEGIPSIPFDLQHCNKYRQKKIQS